MLLKCIFGYFKINEVRGRIRTLCIAITPPLGHLSTSLNLINVHILLYYTLVVFSILTVVTFGAKLHRVVPTQNKCILLYVEWVVAYTSVLLIPIALL